MASRNRLDIQLERQQGILNRACKIPYLHDKAMSSNSTQLFRPISDFISHNLRPLDVEDPVHTCLSVVLCTGLALQHKPCEQGMAGEGSERSNVFSNLIRHLP